MGRRSAIEYGLSNAELKADFDLIEGEVKVLDMIAEIRVHSDTE
jgi:hypothetical protein